MAKPKSTLPKKPGRKPGSPRVAGSGRKKGVPNRLTTSIKELILAKGRPVELLCAVSRGLKVRVGPQAGPATPEWVYPDLPTRINAARTLLGKVVPDLRAQEITGKDGDALLPINLAMDDKELARRVALILVMAGQDDGNTADALAALTDGSSGGPSRHNAGGEGTAVGETPAPSGPSASSPDRPNGADDPPGGRFPARSGPGSGQRAVSEFLKPGDHPPSQNFKIKKPTPKTEPEVGEVAYVAGYAILCGPPQRPGLCLSYRITDSDGKLLAMATDGWQGALRWIKARVGDDADMSIDIIRPTPTAEPIRPDQRQFAVGGPEIDVLRGHETDRKL